MGIMGGFSRNHNVFNVIKLYTMIKADKYYLRNLNKILADGSWDEKPRPKYTDGSPAHSKFITGVFEEYDISKNEFPIPTLRNTAIKTGIKEILWIYQKQTSSLSVAKDMGINWWDSWDIGDGTIGQRYGATVAKYNLMPMLLDGLINEPFSRRHIINLYQYSDLSETKGLFPCAYEVIFSVRKGDSKLVLDMTLIQRSNDYVVAGYINKIQYVALMMMVANHCNYDMGMFRHLVQNLHIYDRHFDAVNELLDRPPLGLQPLLTLGTKKTFNDYTIDDFAIHNVNGIQKLKSNLELAI
jgi:thymidylate synthase